MFRNYVYPWLCRICCQSSVSPAYLRRRWIVQLCYVNTKSCVFVVFMRLYVNELRFIVWKSKVSYVLIDSGDFLLDFACCASYKLRSWLGRNSFTGVLPFGDLAFVWTSEASFPSVCSEDTMGNIYSRRKLSSVSTFETFLSVYTRRFNFICRV